MNKKIKIQFAKQMGTVASLCMMCVLFFAVSGCGKLEISSGSETESGMDEKESISIKEGTYSGTFTVTYSSGKQTGTVKLILENGMYLCSGNADFIPAGGFGTYSIKNDVIVFVDENFWTANFDWNLILKGEYGYSFNGKKLKFSAYKNDVGLYEYDLQKQ